MAPGTIFHPEKLELASVTVSLELIPKGTTGRPEGLLMLAWSSYRQAMLESLWGIQVLAIPAVQWCHSHFGFHWCRIAEEMLHSLSLLSRENIPLACKTIYDFPMFSQRRERGRAERHGCLRTLLSKFWPVQHSHEAPIIFFFPGSREKEIVLPLY